MPKNQNFQPITLKNKKVSWTNFKGLCKGCGLCMVKCPIKAISWDTQHLGVYGTPSVMADVNQCLACGACAQVCPDAAIKVEKCSKKSLSK